MNNYYDYAPKIIPERPVALTGFAGSRSALVGRAVCALTGLPFIDLDRWVEHESGSCLSHLVLKNGQCAQRTLESRLLERALKARPQGIIVLGEGTLLNEGNQNAVTTQATLVYISLSVFELYARIREESAQSPEKYTHLFHGTPDSPEEVHRLLNERLLGYRLAGVAIDSSRKAPIELAREIVSTLKL